MFFRNNGIYIVLATFLILVLTFIKDIIKKEKIVNLLPFSITSICTIIIFFIIQNCYTLIGIEQNPFVESLSIPIQQVARVVVTEGNINNEQMKLIEKILPKEDIKQNYAALIVDRLKWHENFNEKYLEEHKPEYLKLWFELFLQNPR